MGLKSLSALESGVDWDISVLPSGNQMLIIKVLNMIIQLRWAKVIYIGCSIRTLSFIADDYL